MTDDAVSDLLKKLHGALHGAKTISEKDRELLEELSSDIQALLERSGAPAEAEQKGIVDRLQAAVTRFEVTHPDLTATMAQTIQKLGDMGI